MAKQLLVIEGDDQGHFFLSIESGTLTIGDNAKNAGILVRNLHISRIHCEIEVAEERIYITNPRTTLVGPDGSPPRQELQVGGDLHLGNAHLRLQGAGVAAAPARADDDILELAPIPVEEPRRSAARSAPPATFEPAPSAEARLAKRFVVVDGADQGQIFPLPESGTVTIGKNKRNVDIVLNDLYVARVHCELKIDEDGIVVAPIGPNSTLVNGKPITRQPLNLGDVLRVGNSHLRLETAVLEDGSPRPIPSAEDDAPDEGAFEVIEEESGTADAGPDEAAQSEETFYLPHAPVDQLLELEDQVLGHFQIGPLLGRGQSGLVYRAQDLKHNHVVALKVLSPDFPADDEELQRFVRALKVVPQLHHPQLVTLYGAGKTGAYCWMSREFIEGESLARLITKLKEGGKFDWTRACRVAIHLARVLEFLHGHRVIHGNITPRNVLVRQSDKVTKLTDLMLRQALTKSQLQMAIRGRKLLVELPYIAPEQTDLYAPATSVTDIYSLGAVLYALLTGEPPFAGDSPRALLAQVQAGKVVKPSKLQRGIPVAVETAVLKMMARAPEDRFQSASDVLAELEPIAEVHGVAL